MFTFSCARLVIASAARRTTDAPGLGGPMKGTYRFSRATSPGSAPWPDCAGDPRRARVSPTGACPHGRVD